MPSRDGDGFGISGSFSMIVNFALSVGFAICNGFGISADCRKMANVGPNGLICIKYRPNA